MSVVGGMERLVIVFEIVGEGLSCRGRGTFHMPFIGSLVPCNIIFCFFATCSFVLLKIAIQLSSHNCPIDSRLLDFNSGRTCAFFALSLNPGIFIVVVCEEEICLLLGSMTSIGLRVGKVFLLLTSCNLMYV